MAARFDPDEPAGFQRLRRRGSHYSRRAEVQHDAYQQAQSDRAAAGCRKRAYPSKADAEACMARANGGGLHLTRAYRCPACRTWHTTSQRRHG